MKRNLFLVTACFLLLVGNAFASFPVSSEAETNQTEAATEQTTVQEENAIATNDAELSANQEMASEEELMPRMSDKEMWITLALLVFLGGFAAHRWYRGKPVGWNILFILTAGGCGIWAIVDLVNILRKDF